MRAQSFLIFLLCGAPLAAAATAPAPPGGMGEHSSPMSSLRGDTIAHGPTTRHFLLSDKGGVIQIEAKNPGDTTSRDQIRHRLVWLAAHYKAGDFSSLTATHQGAVPGVPEMIKRKDAITYHYEEMERGGRVVITTADPAAKSAVQEFLRSQIAEHRTGDPA